MNRDADTQEQIQWLAEEATYNLPIHVFGHITAQAVYRVKNKYGIDTGAVYGNTLSAIKIFGKGNALVSVPTTEKKTETLPKLFQRPQLQSWEKLTEKEQKRLFKMAENKVQYLSGTMAPAAADKEQNQLESLAKALVYYQHKGIEKVVLEPKYMGSRANIYLHEKLEDCYGISRKGYYIHHEDMPLVFRELQQQFAAYMKKNQIKMLLLDGELLPWRALGENLIKKEYLPVAKGIETELAFLKKSQFVNACQKMEESLAATDFQRIAIIFPRRNYVKNMASIQVGNFKAG